MSASLHITRLRTKTGCLICRHQRKKCDENFPTCGRCARSARPCQWPSIDMLFDRRHRPYRTEPVASSSQAPYHPEAGAATKGTSDTLTLSSSLSHKALLDGVQSAVSSHFIHKYYGLLLIPHSSPDFYHDWITDIKESMTDHKCLQYSVLANAASHLHFRDASPQMQELALVYYSQALNSLSKLLQSEHQVENNNALLTSVILLYLHGCMGRGTYTDVPQHVDAAIKILKLRLENDSKRIERPFDRLAIESVIYQVFLVATGSWTGMASLDHDFDADFWRRCDDLLARSNLYPGNSISFNSPVLGIPFSLFKLTLSLKQLYRINARRTPNTIKSLQEEVRWWEAKVLADQNPDSPDSDNIHVTNHSIYKDAAHLYALLASLLFYQLSASDIVKQPPYAVPSDLWQIQKSMEILYRRCDDDEWERCFIGSWPVYSLGFFMDNARCISVIRHEMQRRWDLMKFAQIARFRRDLEITWTERGFGIGFPT